MSEKENTENRFISIETRLAYMEDFVNQLQEVAVEQEKTIEKLEKENKLLITRMQELSDMAEGDIPNRKPPHY